MNTQNFYGKNNIIAGFYQMNLQDFYSNLGKK